MSRDDKKITQPADEPAEGTTAGLTPASADVAKLVESLDKISQLAEVCANATGQMKTEDLRDLVRALAPYAALQRKSKEALRGRGYYYDRRLRDYRQSAAQPDVLAMVAMEAEIAGLRAEKEELKERYKELLEENKKLQARINRFWPYLDY